MSSPKSLLPVALVLAPLSLAGLLYVTVFRSAPAPESSLTPPLERDAYGREIAPDPNEKAMKVAKAEAPVATPSGTEPEKPKPAYPVVSSVKEKPPVKLIPSPPMDTPAAAVSIRETKPEGSEYDCAAEYTCAGTGRHKAWTAFTGSAHFEAQQVVSWHETVEKNDGERLVLLRNFTVARSNVLVSEAKLGVSDKIRGLAPKVGGALTTSELVGISLINPWVGVGVGATVVATTFADEENLQKWPLVGGIVKDYAARQADEAKQKIQVFQKAIAGLHGQKIRVTFVKGKCERAEYTDGTIVDETVRKWATRATPYMDYNLVPDKLIPVGEEQDKSMRGIASSLGIEPEADQTVDGVIRLKRAVVVPPELAATLAQFEGRSLHMAHFFTPIEGGTIDAKGAPDRVVFKYAYGPQGRYVSEAFVSCNNAEPKTTKDGTLWGQNDDLSGKVSFTVRYTCTPVVKSKE